MQVHAHRHKRKQNTNKDRKEIAEITQHLYVFAIVYTYCTKRTAESMHEVVQQGCYTQDVQDNPYGVLKNFEHAQEKIMRFHAAVVIGYFLQVLCNARRYPEVWYMHHQE